MCLVGSPAARRRTRVKEEAGDEPESGLCPLGPWLVAHLLRLEAEDDEDLARHVTNPRFGFAHTNDSSLVSCLICSVELLMWFACQRVPSLLPAAMRLACWHAAGWAHLGWGDVDLQANVGRSACTRAHAAGDAGAPLPPRCLGAATRQAARRQALCASSAQVLVLVTRRMPSSSRHDAIRAQAAHASGKGAPAKAKSRPRVPLAPPLLPEY